MGSLHLRQVFPGSTRGSRRDPSGNSFAQYRRQDEIGTPFCVTVDFETLGEKQADLRDTVTLRERDSMKQERVKISDLLELLLLRIA